VSTVGANIAITSERSSPFLSAPKGDGLHQVDTFFRKENEGVEVQDVMIEDEKAHDQEHYNEGEARGHGGVRP